VRRPVLQRGFTLAELCIALSIAGILATMAYPSYADAAHRSRRVDAWSALATVQLAQERHRSEHTRYADALETLALGARSAAGHYEVRVLAADRQGYTLEARPVAESPQSKDGTCQRLRVVVQANRQRQQAWSASGDESTRRCFAA
jgi:type IV pilus assembly protein PilE